MGTITTELMEPKRDERRRKMNDAERTALIGADYQSGMTQKAFARREHLKRVEP